MAEEYSLIKIIDITEDAWIAVKNAVAIKGRLTCEGGYAKRFKMVVENQRSVERLVAEGLFDVRGYFQTFDKRALGLFDNLDKTWEIEFQFQGRMESDRVIVRKTNRQDIFGVESAH